LESKHAICTLQSTSTAQLSSIAQPNAREDDDTPRINDQRANLTISHMHPSKGGTDRLCFRPRYQQPINQSTNQTTKRPNDRTTEQPNSSKVRPNCKTSNAIRTHCTNININNQPSSIINHQSSFNNQQPTININDEQKIK